MSALSFLAARRTLICLYGCAMLLVAGPSRASAPSELGGEQVYAVSCAECHGPQGQGTSENKTRLVGDLSVAQLTELIAETMPEDDPGSLTAADAQSVAAYIHDAFYSSIARARNQPARIELARLTVRQYRRVVADLMGSFREPVSWGDERGLLGEYFASRRLRGRRGLVASRIDTRVDFDFGTESPVEEISEPREFSIRWTGSVLAAETGSYEFVIHTEHAARLWINDTDAPLIDAWVKSGDATRYKANLFLVGGRVYPLRLEFTKAKQGVDDSDKQKEKPPSAAASIRLLWRRPQGVIEPIPARHLSPDSAPEQFVCATPFPPDDRSYGWVRGTAISKAWVEATTGAAIETAGYVTDRLNLLAGTQDDAADRPEKLKSFCEALVARAFRQPLTDELARTYVLQQWEAASDPETAVRRVVLLALKSPRFLFREIGGGPDSYDVAARLSFGLWDSIPDEKLLEAARDGRLTTEPRVRAQAERMLSDSRATSKLHQFLLTWLQVDTATDVSKDPEQFPGFDEASIAQLRTSLELFLSEVVQSEESDFRDLLLADEVYLTGKLAKLYGAEVEAVADFTKVGLDDGRAGVLTHPYMMARFAHYAESSPIHRGVLLARGLLGQSLRPPPEAVAPLAPDLHPGLTTRERVALQTKDTRCMTCHRIINPLGFTLEHFDAVGRYRETDRDKPVDVTGAYQTRDGKKINVQGARELAEFLAGSEETHSAFTEQLFHHLVQQPVQAYGQTALKDLRESFVDRKFNIRQLAVEIMVASALSGRPAQVAALPSADERSSQEPNSP